MISCSNHETKVFVLEQVFFDIDIEEPAHIYMYIYMRTGTKKGLVPLSGLALRFNYFLGCNEMSSRNLLSTL